MDRGPNVHPPGERRADRPLAGLSVLVTRPRRQSAALSARLTAAGAEVIDAPTVVIAPPHDWSLVDAAMRDLRAYDWLIVTSANGVAALAARMRRLGLDARDLAGVKIAAIGPATAQALRRRFLRADVMPAEYVAEALAEGLRPFDMVGRRCLLLRSDLARKALPDALTAWGAICDDIAVYRAERASQLPAEASHRLLNGRMDWVTFTSSSTFVNLVSLLGPQADSVLRDVRIASIGPITSAAIRAAGYAPAVEASEYTTVGLVDAMVRSVG